MTMSRLLAVLVLYAVCLGAAGAALLSDRSPVRPGLWWDPLHSGSGFELFRAGNDLALVWYTYREDGLPVWYTATGRFDADGVWETTLYLQKWAAGARGLPRVAGSLRLTRIHAERIDARWQLGTRGGALALSPFPLSGVAAEVDHSGAWFDPDRSGFGLSLSESGDAVAAGLYFYDAQGEPTWRVGLAAPGEEIMLRGLRGTCPGCSAGPSGEFDHSRLGLIFRTEDELHAVHSGSALGEWGFDATLRQISTPMSRRAADRQLARFADEAELSAWLRAALIEHARRGREPGVDFSAPPPSGAFSTTILQEAGVDEADRLKTDGRFVYALANGTGEDPASVLRVAEVDAAGEALTVRAGLRIAPPEGGVGRSGLYVTDTRLVAVESSVPIWAGDPIWFVPQVWEQGRVRVSIFDRSAPAAPVPVWSAELEGHLVSSRRIGSKLYLVTRHTSAVDGLEYDRGNDAALAQRNQDRIEQTPTAALLPRIRVGDDTAAWQTLLQPADVYLPPVGSQWSSPEFVTVVAIDIGAPDQRQALSVAGSVTAVYVSPAHLYLASVRNALRVNADGTRAPEGLSVTELHQIALDASGPRFVASGAVEGFIDRDSDRAAFRFSEYEGHLRVVTVGSQWGALGRNRLTVLTPSVRAEGVLHTVSYLPNAKAPAPIGKPDELLYGTRFLGDRLYAVTFLQTDPLYVVDISDPAAPRIAGEVELPGFADYLHPVGEHLLFGLGLDAIPASDGSNFAWFAGLQFSLFDVSDPLRPRVLQRLTLGKRGSGSAALVSHHGLSVLPTGTGARFALPVYVTAPNGSEPVPTPDSHYYPWSWSGLQTLQVQGQSPADATLTLGPSFATHRRETGAQEQGYDAAQHARSVQFERGTVYVEGGRFWLIDAAGQRRSGPL